MIARMLLYIIGAGVVVASVRYILPFLITGTSFGDNTVKYIVPFCILLFALIGVFMTIRRKTRGK